MRTLFGRACTLALAIAMAAPAAAAAQDTPDVVFAGSSILRRWTALATQMTPLRVVNVSLDGTTTYDLLGLLGSRVIPRKPKVVVYYGGSNDVDLGESATAIVGRVVQFNDRLKAALPQARLVYISVNRSPDHADLWPVIDDINRQMHAYAMTHPLVDFVDVNPALFNRDGSPRIDVYMPDQRHLRRPAYEDFAEILKPVLVRAVE
jgi:lysophospholipase L1-like esterase